MKVAIIFTSVSLLACCVSGCQNNHVGIESILPPGKFDQLKVNNAYIVFGCVMRQGQYRLASNERLTVSQAILRANGLSSHANGRQVKLHRRVPFRPGHFILVDVEAILGGSRRKKDPLVQPGDVIVVQDTSVTF